MTHPLGFPNSRPRPCAKSGGGSPWRSRPPLAANASGTTCLCPTVRGHTVYGWQSEFISIAIAHSGGWAPSFQAKAVFCKHENITQCNFYSVNSLRGSQDDVKGEENESMCLWLPCPSFLADAAHCITAKKGKAKEKYIYKLSSYKEPGGFPWNHDLPSLHKIAERVLMCIYFKWSMLLDQKNRNWHFHNICRLPKWFFDWNVLFFQVAQQQTKLTQRTESCCGFCGANYAIADMDHTVSRCLWTRVLVCESEQNINRHISDTLKCWTSVGSFWYGFLNRIMSHQHVTCMRILRSLKTNLWITKDTFYK